MLPQNNSNIQIDVNINGNVENSPIGNLTINNAPSKVEILKKICQELESDINEDEDTFPQEVMSKIEKGLEFIVSHFEDKEDLLKKIVKIVHLKKERTTETETIRLIVHLILCAFMVYEEKTLLGSITDSFILEIEGFKRWGVDITSSYSNDISRNIPKLYRFLKRNKVSEKMTGICYILKNQKDIESDICKNCDDNSEIIKSLLDNLPQNIMEPRKRNPSYIDIPDENDLKIQCCAQDCVNIVNIDKCKKII